MNAHAPPTLPLPNWPALMGLELALAYTQLGESSFRFLTRKRGVAPVDPDGLTVTRWARADLDRLIDSLPRRGAPMAADGPQADESSMDTGLPDAAQLALQRARRRGKR